MSSRTLALLRSPIFLGHDVGGHPEQPDRLRAIDRWLEEHDLLAHRPSVTFTPATDAELSRIHDQAYLDALVEATAHGGGWIDGDTALLPDSLGAAKLAAGAGLAATNAVLSSATGQVFVLARPPGHHATPSRGMGFCLLNTVAVAAAMAADVHHARVAIVDWDVHHGNGTQDAFYDRDDVLFISIHQYGSDFGVPFYPGTGAASERGRGRGAGYTVNFPLPPGQTDEVYIGLVNDQIVPLLEAFQPDILFLSAGFDAHHRDPIGGMNLTADGFGAMATILAGLADRLCGGKVVAILEGGYDLVGLASSVGAMIQAFDGTVPPHQTT